MILNETYLKKAISKTTENIIEENEFSNSSDIEGYYYYVALTSSVNYTTENIKLLADMQERLHDICYDYRIRYFSDMVIFNCDGGTMLDSKLHRAELNDGLQTSVIVFGFSHKFRNLNSCFKFFKEILTDKLINVQSLSTIKYNGDDEYADFIHVLFRTALTPAQTFKEVENSDTRRSKIKSCVESVILFFMTFFEKIDLNLIEKLCRIDRTKEVFSDLGIYNDYYKYKLIPLQVSKMSGKEITSDIYRNMQMIHFNEPYFNKSNRWSDSSHQKLMLDTLHASEEPITVSAYLFCSTRGGKIKNIRTIISFDAIFKINSYENIRTFLYNFYDYNVKNDLLQNTLYVACCLKPLVYMGNSPEYLIDQIEPYFLNFKPEERDSIKKKIMQYI